MDELLNTAEIVYKRLELPTAEPCLQYLMFMPKHSKQVTKNIFSRHLIIFFGLPCFVLIVILSFGFYGKEIYRVLSLDSLCITPFREQLSCATKNVSVGV